MLRSGRLAQRRRLRSRSEEVNPMDNVANLVDVMLVFVSGLMLSIITFWNVDLKAVQAIFTEENLVEVDKPEEIVEQAGAAYGFEERGLVYEDPETGKMYLLEPKSPQE